MPKGPKGQKRPADVMNLESPISVGLRSLAPRRAVPAGPIRTYAGDPLPPAPHPSGLVFRGCRPGV